MKHMNVLLAPKAGIITFIIFITFHILPAKVLLGYTGYLIAIRRILHPTCTYVINFNEKFSAVCVRNEMKFPVHCNFELLLWLGVPECGAGSPSRGALSRVAPQVSTVI